MNKPTDPLPEPWVWYNYQEEAWAAYNARRYLAWTFQPVFGPNKQRLDGFKQLKTTDWIVKSHHTKHVVGAYDAVFPTREEATQYISARAMLGTFEEPA